MLTTAGKTKILSELHSIKYSKQRCLESYIDQFLSGIVFRVVE